MTKKLLRQTTTGHIYMWTENLASRPDMEPYELPSTRENTSENPEQASAEDAPSGELDQAKAAFRRQVSKVGRKPSKRTSGET